jgi:hypothetical protein
MPVVAPIEASTAQCSFSNFLPSRKAGRPPCVAMRIAVRKSSPSCSGFVIFLVMKEMPSSLLS